MLNVSDHLAVSVRLDIDVNLSQANVHASDVPRSDWSEAVSSGCIQDYVSRVESIINVSLQCMDRMPEIHIDEEIDYVTTRIIHHANIMVLPLRSSKRHRPHS